MNLKPSILNFESVDVVEFGACPQPRVQEKHCTNIEEGDPKEVLKWSCYHYQVNKPPADLYKRIDTTTDWHEMNCQSTLLSSSHLLLGHTGKKTQ